MSINNKGIVCEVKLFCENEKGVKTRDVLAPINQYLEAIANHPVGPSTNI